jgi:hypothetical protein
MKGMSDKTKGTTEHGNSAELVCMARVVQISDLPQMPPPQIAGITPVPGNMSLSPYG